MCILTREEWWCLKVHVVQLETFYTRLKSFFKADLSTNTTHLHDGVTLLLRPESFSYFTFIFCFILDLVIPARSNALIYTRKRIPEEAFFFFIACFIFAKPQFFTLTTLAPYNLALLFSYDIINTDKKN